MGLRHLFRRVILSGMMAANLAAITACHEASPKKRLAIPDVAKGTITHCSDKNHAPKYAHSLTRNEAEFVQGIFGKSIDTKDTRLYLVGTSASYKDDIRALECNTQRIEFYGTERHSDDYSHAGLDSYGTFIHEMTHVWQDQTIGYKNCHAANRYEYTLDGKHKFTDYCGEQQASIVKDYARHFLHPWHEGTEWYKGKDSPTSFVLLAKVVEDQFPQAQKTRLAIEAKEASRKAWITAKAGMP